MVYLVYTEFCPNKEIRVYFREERKTNSVYEEN